MQKTFREFYKPSESEISEIWEKGIFIIDTNVLLDLYRYSKETREKLLSILHAIDNQLWIPYWVGYEFHRERLIVIEEKRQDYDTIIRSLDSVINTLQQYRKHPTLSLDGISKKISTLKSNIAAQKRNHSSWYESDIILDEITKIFEGKVGDAYNEKRLSEITKIGEERYKRYQPPGYLDAKKVKNDPTGLRQYGDLIIWFQIMDKAKQEQKPIIFVTEDGKEDWWNPEIHGRKQGPQTELVSELLKAANVMLLMYDTEAFMKQAGEKFSSPVTRKTIDEIKQLKSLSAIQQSEVVSGEVTTSESITSGTAVVSSDSNSNNNTGGSS